MKIKLAVLALLLTVVGALAQTNVPPVDPGVTLPDPTGFLTFLTGKFPWIAGVLTWVLMLRLVAKPVSGWLQGLATKALLYVQGTPETDDDAWIENILKSKAYRVVAFLVDWTTSIKMPTSASIAKVVTDEPKPPVIPLLLALTLFSGCVTGPNGTQQPDIHRISAVAREAATVGTQEALLARPDWYNGFATAHDELVRLSNQPTIGVGDLLDILNRLPVKELKSRDARIAISVARITIAGANWSVIDAERLDQIKPVIIAIYEGMEAGGVQ